jgi:RNA polymerase sigma factor for flagellar operon FliA
MQRRKTSSLPQPTSESVSERAVLDLLPLVRHIARRIHVNMPPMVDIEDLFSAGMVGLVEASAGFDPAKKAPFASYASFRIRGAILDSLRAGDWAPRQLRRKGRAVKEAIRTITPLLGRAPSEDEIAGALHTSLHAYQKLLGELDVLKVGTLHRTGDEASDEEDIAYASGRPEDDPLFCSMRGETKKRLTEAIQDLPEQERLVAARYYYEELTQGEIGLALGKGEPRIQQIRTSALRHLRSSLSDLPLHYCGSKILRLRSRRAITLALASLPGNEIQALPSTGGPPFNRPQMWIPVPMPTPAAGPPVSLATPLCDPSFAHFAKTGIPRSPAFTGRLPLAAA